MEGYSSPTSLSDALAKVEDEQNHITTYVDMLEQANLNYDQQETLLLLESHLSNAKRILYLIREIENE